MAEKTVSRARAACVLVVLAAGIAWIAPADGSWRTKASAARSALVAQLWGRRYQAPAFDSAFAPVFSPDGSKVYVTGSTTVSSGDEDYLTLAYDASTGTTLWSRQFAGPDHGFDEAYAIGISPDGSKVFVTGTSHSVTGLDYLTLAYDASTGQRLWLQRYNPNANLHDAANALTVSPDGSKVFVTGYSTAASGAHDVATLAYDTSTGARIWLDRYHSVTSDDIAWAIAVAPDGTKVFVADASGGRYRTIGYDAWSGAELWVARYSAGLSADSPSSIAVSPDSSTVYVTGQTYRTQNQADYGTLAYDSTTGAEEWSAFYNGGNPGSRADDARAITVSADGQTIFVTGGSTESNGSTLDYATVAYSAAGVQKWATREHSAGGDSVAQSLALTPDGTKVIVTGLSTGTGSGFDYLTLAYTPNGQLIWRRRNNGVGNGYDLPRKLAVSPDGTRVVVTGQSDGTTTHADWSTLMYTTG